MSIFKIEEEQADILHTAYVVRKFGSAKFYKEWINYHKSFGAENILPAILEYYHSLEQEPDEKWILSIPKLPKRP